MADVQKTDAQVSPTNQGFNPMIWVGVILLIVIGGGYYFMNTNKKTDEPAVITPSTQSESVSPVTSGSVLTEDNNVKTIEMEGGSFYFKPDKITVKEGDTVKIVLKSVDKIHNLYLDEFNVKSSDAKTGETTTVEFTAGKKGTYEFYCAIGQHRAMGMKGTLIVE